MTDMSPPNSPQSHDAASVYGYETIRSLVSRLRHDTPEIPAGLTTEEAAARGCRDCQAEIAVEALERVSREAKLYIDAMDGEGAADDDGLRDALRAAGWDVANG